MWKNTDHPISRFRFEISDFYSILPVFSRQYLLGKNWWTLEEDAEFKKSAKKEVLQGNFDLD